MKDEDKVKEQLMNELVEMRQRIAGLKVSETEHKQAEEALRKSEAKNRALLNAIPDLMFRISKDGTFLVFKAAKDGDPTVPPSELLGKNVYEVLPREVSQRIMHHVEQALQTSYTQIFEYQLLVGGNMRDHEARIVVSGEDEVLVIVRDITERTVLYEKSQKQAKELRALYIATSIHKSLNLQEIYNVAMDMILDITAFDVLMVYLVDENTNEAVLQAHRGLYQEGRKDTIS